MIRAFLFLFLLLAVGTQGDLIVDEECLNYTIYPVQYELIIIPYIYKDRSFYDCQISITVIANAPNIRMIELEAKNLTINGESIQVLKGDRDIVNKPRPYTYDIQRGKLYIYLSESLVPYKGRYKQNYVIRMSFRKDVTFESTGIFLVKYFDEYGTAKYLLQTRLSPDNAKYFMPCFDNPRFESVFKFIVYEMPEDRQHQHTNTSLVIAQEIKREVSPEKTIKIHYVPSPQVTLYQVGFHYSLFSDIETSSKYTNDTLVVWAPDKEIKYCYYILNFGQTIVDLLHEYSRVNRTLVSGPINIVGVPTNLNGYEIASWNLLINDATRVQHRPEYISIGQIEILKFELAQQLTRIWLGNPGEPARTRWKEEWFKEGVATYLAYYLLAQYDSGAQNINYKNSLDEYGLHIKHIAMLIDWHHTTPALIKFNNDLAVNIPHRHRELITMKTAALLWMVENWIGPDKFHPALVKYINDRRGKYISLADFMASLDHDTVECFHQFFNGSTASRILNSWFHYSGYPVIEVDVMRDLGNDAIRLKQRRFSFTRDSRQETDFLIPISYTVQNVSNCYNCYQPRFTISKQTYTFKETLNNGWIILNRNAAGYYRVKYDDKTWKLIAKTLKENLNLIDEYNRAQIVNDVFAFYAAGDMSEDLARYVLDYLDQERSFVVWEAVMNGYEMLRIEGAACYMTKTLYGEWQNFLREKVATIYKILTNRIDVKEKTRSFRSRIVEFACSVKYQKCLEYVERLYRQWRTRNQRIDPDSRTACYYVLYNSGRSLSSEDKLNAYELKDKSYAEYIHRRESNFLVKIPKGEPRPENLTMTTHEPEPVSTEKSALIETNSKDGAGFLIASLYMIISSISIPLAMR